MNRNNHLTRFCHWPKTECCFFRIDINKFALCLHGTEILYWVFRRCTLINKRSPVKIPRCDSPEIPNRVLHLHPLAIILAYISFFFRFLFISTFSTFSILFAFKLQFMALTTMQYFSIFHFDIKSRANAFTWKKCAWIRCHSLADLHPFTNFAIFTIIWNVC